MKFTIRFAFPAFVLLACTMQSPAQVPSSVPQADKNEIDARLQEDRLARTRRDLRTLIVRVEAASSTLDDIGQRAAAFDRRLTDLLTNEDGKRIAQDFIAANAVLRLREQPFLVAADIKAKKQAADNLVTLLTNEDRNPNVGYVVPDSSVAEVEDLYAWSRQRSAELSAREATLQDMVSKASAVTLPPNAASLGQVLDAFVAARIRLWAELIQKGEELGKEQTKPVMVDAARLAELERTVAKMEELKAQAKIDADRIRQDYELRLRTAAREQEELRIKAEIADKDAKADIERLKKAADAARFAESVKRDIQTAEVVSTAEHERLVAKAKTAQVQTLLKPFLGKGYQQPGERRRGIESKNMSLAAIRSFGALDYSPEGLRKLLEIGRGVGGGRYPYRTNDRAALWAYPEDLDALTTAQLEEVKLAQKYLLELGDVMVELGMLEP